jgi:hypothetical protein
MAIAVFTRNHRCYLEEACNVSRVDASRSITFRSNTKWASIATEIAKGHVVPIYVAAIEGKGLIQWTADLIELDLEPDDSRPETRRLLGYALGSTKKEGVWSLGKGTLYAASNYRALKEPFAMTRLVKYFNSKPLSSEFNYSYSIVHAIACK